MLRLSLVALLVAMASARLAPAQSSRATGSVRGIVREPGRTPLASVTVVLGPDPASPSPAAFTAYAITGADGRFEIPNVPPGTYWVCPQMGNSDYLNPCIWNPRPPTATIALSPAARASADLDLTLARGTPLYVQVDDPHALLSRPGGPSSSDGDLVVGAKSGAGHTAYAQPPMRSRGGQRLYRVIVPLGTPYVPVLDTGKFQVEHGAPGERLASPFNQSAESRIGEAPKVFRLSVRTVAR